MRYTLALAALCSFAASTPSPVAAPAPEPQGVTAALYPTTTPSSCSPTYMNGDYFQIGLLAPGSSKAKRQVGPGVNPDALPGNILLLSLLNGKLTDGRNRTGYIASNGQLQFDVVPQSDATITRGFSACPNDTLALGSTTWYRCGSGGFANLYDRSLGAQCDALNFMIYLYTGDVSSAIAGISAATMTGAASATATNVVAGIGSATSGGFEALTTAASGSGSVSSGSASATAAGSMTASRTMSTGTQASSAATSAAATTAAAGSNGASASTSGRSLSALVILVGFVAFML